MVLLNVSQWSRILGWVVKGHTQLRAFRFPWRKEIGISCRCPERQPLSDLKYSSSFLLSFVNPRIQPAIYQQVVSLVSWVLNWCLKGGDHCQPPGRMLTEQKPPYAHGTEACVFSTFEHPPSPSVLYTKLVCLFQIWSLLFADLTVLDLMYLLPEVFPAIQLIPTIPPQTEQSRNKVLRNDVRFVVTCNVNDWSINICLIALLLFS